MGSQIAGVDEAGRGPVIGPMVVAGVVVDESKLNQLAAAGVRDSKLLTPKSRCRLAETIWSIADRISIVEVQPTQIDEVVLHGSRLRKLNFLEARIMAQVINELLPRVAYVDACDVKESRFGQTIADFLVPEVKKIRVISEHRADATYPVVSAASIIAKVHRDEIVEKLHQQYGDFGSGYMRDPRTNSFLRHWRLTQRGYPPIVRKSWKTIKRIEQELPELYGRLQ